MCILITEEDTKNKVVISAKTVGLKESQWKPTADLVWNMKTAKANEAISILVRTKQCGGASYDR